MKPQPQAKPQPQVKQETTLWHIVVIVACIFLGKYLISLANERTIVPYVASILKQTPAPKQQTQTPVQLTPAPAPDAYPKPVQDMMDRKINAMWQQAGTH